MDGCADCHAPTNQPYRNHQASKRCHFGSTMLPNADIYWGVQDEHIIKYAIGARVYICARMSKHELHMDT